MDNTAGQLADTSEVAILKGASNSHGGDEEARDMRQCKFGPAINQQQEKPSINNSTEQTGQHKPPGCATSIYHLTL